MMEMMDNGAKEITGVEVVDVGAGIGAEERL